MLRIMPFTRSAEAGAAIANTVEFNFALFVLAIEFCPPPAGMILGVADALWPDQGYYRIRAQVYLRSEAVADFLKRHKLQNLELFMDAKGKKVAEGLLEAAREKIAETPLETMMVAYPVLMWKQAMAEQRLSGIVCLTLNNLMKGAEIAGTQDELRFCQSALLGAVDKVHARLLFALQFDEQTVIIANPGKPPKKGKDKKKGGPSSSWFG